MNIVDTSGWIEYFLPQRTLFRPLIEDTSELIVPSVCIHEVIKVITRAKSRDSAREAVMHMQRAAVVDLDAHLASLSARLSLRYSLPMADSIIYAAAQDHEATLYTQDADLAKLPGVRYIRPRG